MRTFFTKLSKVDWIALVLCLVFVLLTILPMTPLVSLGEPWHVAVLISCGAVTLSSIVIAQVHARESDKDIADHMSGLELLMRNSISPGAVREIASSKIQGELEGMLQRCSEWYFRGGSARWQREKVLPSLARIKDRPVTYKVQIISPFEADLCEKYARYRQKSQPGDDRGDAKRISLELVAFLYAVTVWQSRSKIVPEVTLLHRFSPFRLDGDSQNFIITVADLQKNGLQTCAGNWYHASLLDEFEFEAGYATSISLPPDVKDASGADGLEYFLEEVCRLNPAATEKWTPNYSDVEKAEIVRISGTKIA